MMGELQISNLPMILIAIAVMCIGVLGYFEIKKLYLKLSEIDTKLDDINESLNKRQIPQQIPSSHQMTSQQLPPHIIEQRRIMMLRQQQLIQEQMKNKEKDQELNMESDFDEKYEDRDNHYGEELSSRSSSRSSYDESGDDDDIISKDDDHSKDEIISKDEDNESISKTSEMTIELDNEFNHLSVKESKEIISFIR